MEKQKYQELVKKQAPKEDRIKNGIKAFLIGGSVGLLAEALVNLYTNVFEISRVEANTYMIITLIFFACLFTGIGFFDDIVKWAGAGLIVPITGFAHSVMSSTMEYRKEGLVTGIGANMFKLAGSVIAFGIISAYLFGLIRICLFGGSIWRLNIIMFI